MGESLPNITGSFDRPNAYSKGPANGAFYLGNNVGGYSRAINSTDSSYVNFDASRSSTVYKDKAHVIPLSIATAFLIRY